MTTMERAEATLSEAERVVRRVVRPERLRAASERLTALAETRGEAWRDRLRAADDGTPSRLVRRPPHRLVVAIRSLGMAWAALMLATLTIAIATRASARKATAATEPDADEINLRTVLGPMAFTSRATAFRGGVVDCWYGGGFVDLREATLDPAGATLRVRAVFGGGQIVVPGTWRVTTRVRGIGAASDIRPATDRAADAPHLAIEGLAVFGGFAVQAELAEAQKAALEDAVAKVARADRHPEPAPSAASVSDGALEAMPAV